MVWHDDELDTDVDEMPTPFGERDALDQAQEVGMLLAVAVLLVSMVVVPALGIFLVLGAVV